MPHGVHIVSKFLLGALPLFATKKIKKKSEDSENICYDESQSFSFWQLL
jgi:hypothetical protein